MNVSLDENARDAFLRIENLCSYQEYSKHKMTERLRREDFNEDCIENAIDFAVHCNIINDMRYGEALAHSRYRAGKGRAGIERELWSHGIDPDSIDGWPFDFIDRYGAEESRAAQVVESRSSRSKNPSGSAYRRLVSRGFEPSLARKVVMEIFGL